MRRDFRLSALLTTLVLLVHTGAAAQDQSLRPPMSGTATWPNAYADDLAEQLTDLGRATLQDGDPALAVRHLQEAIQAIKANHGLHSARQVPVLELLIISQIARGDWQQADVQVDYFEWLNERNFRNDLQAYLEGTRALSDLLLIASGRRDNPSSVRHLVQAKNLNWQAVSTIEANLGKESLELVPWLYRIILNHYYQATLVRRRHLTNYAFKTDDAEIISGWSMPHNELLDMSYRIGRELLGRIAALFEQAPGLPTEARALARAHQGDWELLFGRHGSALEYYRQAYRDLRDLGLSQAEADGFFNRPVVIPPGRLQTRMDRIDTPQPLEFVAWSPLYPGVELPPTRLAAMIPATDRFSAHARFNLLPAPDSAGEAEGAYADLNPALGELTVLATEPANPRLAELARDKLRLLQLRPRLRAGSPAVLENVEILYRFAPQQDLLSLTENRR